MKKKLISILLAGCMILGFTACKPYDDIKSRFNKSEPAANETADETEKTAVSNAITVGMYDFDTFNPLMTKSQTVKEAMEFIYEPLFTTDERIRPVPQLAVDYGMSADGKTITINLRNDVKWHDGTGMSAYDAAYTIRQIKSGATTYTDALNDVLDWRVTGDYQITVSFNRPIPMAAALFTFPIVQYGTAMQADPGYMPIGTGPFSYSGKISTDRYMLNAFDYYYNGRARIDGVYIDLSPDAEHYVSMYSSGAFDVATSKVIDLRSYTPKGSVALNEYVSDNLTFIGINHAKQELSGINTREAMSALTDRENIVSSVMYSRAVETDVPINPSSWIRDGEAPSAAAEMSPAEHIRIDGWTDENGTGYERMVNGSYQALSFKLLVNKDNPEKTAIAEKIAADFTTNGIKTTVEPLPYDQYSARIASGQYDLFIGEYKMPSTQDASALIGGGGNMFGFKSDSLDTLMTQIGMTSNEDELKQLYMTFEEEFRKQMPIIPIAYSKECMMSSPVLQEVKAPGTARSYSLSETWVIK